MYQLFQFPDQLSNKNYHPCTCFHQSKCNVVGPYTGRRRATSMLLESTYPVHGAQSTILDYIGNSRQPILCYQ